MNYYVLINNYKISNILEKKSSKMETDCLRKKLAVKMVYKLILACPKSNSSSCFEVFKEDIKKNMHYKFFFITLFVMEGNLRHLID